VKLTLPKQKIGLNGLTIILVNIAFLSVIGIISYLHFHNVINPKHIAYFIYYGLIFLVIYGLGLYPLYMLYMTLRPKHNEIITLTPSQLYVDTGAAPLRFSQHISNHYRQIGNSRRKLFAVDPINTLKTRLMRDGDRTYLQVIHNNKYVDIAHSTSNEVREFLFHHILDYYESLARKG